MRAVPAEVAARRPPLKRSRKFEPKPARPSLAPRIVRYLLILLALVTMADAVFGDRGFIDTLRARHDYAALERHVARLRAENASLREEARRLKEDPAAIESLARDELGLIYPGETLFIISDRTTR